jgi:hypothetical protein
MIYQIVCKASLKVYHSALVALTASCMQMMLLFFSIPLMDRLHALLSYCDILCLNVNLKNPKSFNI